MYNIELLENVEVLQKTKFCSRYFLYIITIKCAMCIYYNSDKIYILRTYLLNEYKTQSHIHDLLAKKTKKDLLSL